MYPLSPTYRYCRYNDVVVDRAIRYCHLPFEPGNAYRSAMIQDIPGYEKTLCQGLRESVETGDHVVTVGGGFGVTTVHAARLTGLSGRVTSFEASEEQFSSLEWGIEANEQREVVTPVHGLVGEEVVVYGEKSSADKYSPQELPPCDVLELDCEGAETEILRLMKIRPRVILVETHGFRGAPTSNIEDQLREIGYKVGDLKVAEP